MSTSLLAAAALLALFGWGWVYSAVQWFDTSDELPPARLEASFEPDDDVEETASPTPEATDEEEVTEEPAEE